MSHCYLSHTAQHFTQSAQHPGSRSHCARFLLRLPTNTVTHSQQIPTLNEC